MHVNFAANCIPVLIQQHVNGSDTFNRSWAEYKVGFNDTRGNYWLGNEQLHQLTVNGRYKVRFDLQRRDTNGTWDYAEYSRFVVLSEATNYTLIVSGYSGNARDGLSPHNGMMFTTYDRNNDRRRRNNRNCAVHHGGGFWYRSCAEVNFNGYRYFDWYFSLQTSRMWLTC